MRRERRRFERNDTDIKRVLYTAGGILFISIITFIAMFLLNSNNSQEEQRLAMFNTEMMEGSNTNSSVEETSTQTGRTVNEMLNEVTNNVATNELTDGDSNESNTNNTDSGSDKTKYAVNTSNVEGKKVEENTDSSNSTKASESTKKDEEATVKDPEFKMPVEGEIMREYAKDNLVYSATLDEWVTHNGIDIAAEKTTVVKASADGTVKSIKNDPRYGLTIVIEHVNGFTTVYSNLLTAEFVEEGEKVEQGETIGTVGNTATFEIADEAHLHFEILKDNENLDPELYLK